MRARITLIQRTIQRLEQARLRIVQLSKANPVDGYTPLNGLQCINLYKTYSDKISKLEWTLREELITELKKEVA